MAMTRRTTFALTAALLASVSFSPAFAAGTTINVSLWDKGDTSMDGLGKTPPIILGGETAADMSKATMGITLDKTEVPAGEVTFKATNDSKVMIHEMVLSPVADMTKPLPYLADENKVDEDAAGHLGEVAELDPGASGALTISMKPGSYILYCNIPGHYELGMWTILTVK